MALPDPFRLMKGVAIRLLALALGALFATSAYSFVAGV